MFCFVDYLCIEGLKDILILGLLMRKKTFVIIKDFWSQKPNIRNDKSKFFK